MAEFQTPVLKRVKTCHVQSPSISTPQIVIPPSPCMKQLGYGTGVNVYLMERFSPMHGSYKSPWAVKKLNKKKITDDNGEFTKRLSFEAEILRTLSHPNIIGYRSYTSHKDGTPCLVMESGERSLGDLIEAREEQDLGPFPAKNVLKVAGDIASALKYLHEDMKLLHGDLKSANILTKGQFEVAKLCDFGVSLRLDEQGMALKNQAYVGTECWSASEALLGDTLTHRTDMFSYGLILWEMLSLTAPHVSILDCDDLDTTDSFSMQEDEYAKALGTRPPLPNVVLGDEYLPVLEIFYACTETEQAKRPSASQVLHVLMCVSEGTKPAETGDSLEDEKETVGKEKCIEDENDIDKTHVNDNPEVTKEENTGKSCLEDGSEMTKKDYVADNQEANGNMAYLEDKETSGKKCSDNGEEPDGGKRYLQEKFNENKKCLEEYKVPENKNNPEEQEDADNKENILKDDKIINEDGTEGNV